MQEIKGLDAWTRPEKVDRYGIPDAFEVLGPRAASAIPTLAHLANYSTNSLTHSLAAQALLKIGPPAFPALNHVLTNQSCYNRPGNIMAMGFLGPAASPATPFLIQCLSDKNPSIVRGAVATLGKMGQPDLAVPALTNLLLRLNLDDNKNTDLAVGIIRSLRAYRFAARDAAPAIIQSLPKLNLPSNERSIMFFDLFDITDSPELLVPIATRYLSDTNAYYMWHWKAAERLASLGRPAQPALPALTNVLQQSTGRLYQVISNAIQQITSPSPQPEPSLK